VKKLVSVSLGPARLDYEFEAELWGERFHVRRVGTDGDTEAARRLVREHDGQVDCIALAGMAMKFTVGRRTWYHKETLRIARAARSTPVVGGRSLKRIVDRWSIREIARRQPQLFDSANVLFLSGIANWDAASVMTEFTESIAFADPVLHYGLPTVLPHVRALHAYAAVAMPILTRRPYVSFFPRGKTAAGIQQAELLRFFQQADVVVGDLLLMLHYAPADMQHKVVVTDSVDRDALETFRERGVELLCTTTPQVFGEKRADLQILHAACVAHLGRQPDSIGDDDYLRLLKALEARPRIIHPQGETRRRRKFAYLYYPPGELDLYRSPATRWLRNIPEQASALVERAAANLPIRPYSRVRGIKSPTGEEAEGWILYLPATAHEIERRGPRFAERRVREAVELARSLGASVLGVGCFCREMTRATQAVASQVDLPITSGASYLVSANMWAAKQAILALGVPQDEVGRAKATAMVVGAGDPEGAVAAELLALVFQRVVLVDREPDRLLELTHRIARHSPHCAVEVATRPDGFLADSALVVAGLAPGWAHAVEIGMLRTGAVLADCARPPEYPLPVAETRPDVLVIRAGEIELPGPAQLGADLGPPPKVAFASLAEVVVLALEGRSECFSLGDHVELEKVKEIYKLGLRHGMQLAAIRGITGPVGDTTIRLVRERAAARQRAEQAPPPLEATDAPVPGPTA
jgi:predicted amino acid dehydrogenase